MPLDLRNDLQNAEEDLIMSINEGTSALEGFRDTWSTLFTSLQTQHIDNDTSQLAYETASRVAVIASGFLKDHEEAAAIKSSFITELDDLLSQLSLDDMTPCSTAAPSNSSSKSRPEHSTSPSPPYIAPAYKWLLNNIHNPYPTKETKQLISRGTGTSLQNIDAWFLNARRRIGWTTISKKYFSGSKTDTVAAAHRALVKEDSTLSYNSADNEEFTPLPANIRMAFVEMEDAAKELYTERFTRSKLAGRLDGIVKDMTDDDRKRRQSERKSGKAEAKLRREREREEQKMREAERRWQEAEEGYPSSSPEPESLKARFETPASQGSDAEDDTTPPPPIAGRKRASSEEIDEAERPAKRSRMLPSSSSYQSADNLLSSNIEPVPSSPSSSTCSTPPPSTPSEVRPVSLPNAVHKRKRRLSDADGDSTPKRPMQLVRPRLQVVSDPLPKTIALASPITMPSNESSILDWCQQFFDTPSTAVTDELEGSGPFELNVFDYSQLAEYASSGDTSEGSEWESHTDRECSKGKNFWDPSSSSSPSIHIPSLTFTDFDLPGPIPLADSIHLDLDPNFCTTTAWPYISDKPNPPPPTFENIKLHNLEDLSSLVSLPSDRPCPTYLEPCSDEAAFDPLGSIDWPSIIPQTIPPTRPVALTPFQTSINPTVCMGSSDSRAEKLRKYQEHIAKARQLEVELAYA